MSLNVGVGSQGKRAGRAAEEPPSSRTPAATARRASRKSLELARAFLTGADAGADRVLLDRFWRRPAHHASSVVPLRSIPCAALAAPSIPERVP
jgi:hypothetical protein